MNMHVALLSIIGLVMAANCGVGAEKLLSPVKFDSGEEIVWENLKPHVLKLSDRLEAELPDNEDPEANVAAAEQMLRELGSALMGDKKAKKQALKLFVSLKDAANKCDKESMKILGRGYVAILDEESSKRRTYQVLNHFLAKHAETCRPQFKREFAELVTKVSKEDLRLIRRSVSGLRGVHFQCISKIYDEWQSLLRPYAMDEPEFLPECSKEARREISRNFFYEASKSFFSDTVLPSKIPADVVDGLLFKPCKNLVDQMGDLLTLARFDAVYEDSEQENFIHGDLLFREALSFNRVCSSLLKDKSKLYKPLAAAAKEANNILVNLL